jgi:hypothetical protein
VNVNVWGVVNTWSSQAIAVTATLGTISYTSNNVTVFVKDGKDIGVVTAGFKEDSILFKFKPNSITVNFRG